MKNSKDYIKNIIDTLIEDFKDIKCSYIFESSCDIHFIEIRPLHLFDDENLIDKQVDIMNEFEELYPYEALSFISEDSLYKPLEFDYQMAGNLYADIWESVALDVMRKPVKNTPPLSSDSVFEINIDYSLAA